MPTPPLPPWVPYAPAIARHVRVLMPFRQAGLGDVAGELQGETLHCTPPQATGPTPRLGEPRLGEPGVRKPTWFVPLRRVSSSRDNRGGEREYASSQEGTESLGFCCCGEMRRGRSRGEACGWLGLLRTCERSLLLLLPRRASVGGSVLSSLTATTLAPGGLPLSSWPSYQRDRTRSAERHSLSLRRLPVENSQPHAL